MSDQSLEIKDRSSEKDSNFISFGKTSRKFSQSRVIKIIVKGKVIYIINIILQPFPCNQRATLTFFDKMGKDQISGGLNGSRKDALS